MTAVLAYLGDDPVGVDEVGSAVASVHRVLDQAVAELTAAGATTTWRGDGGAAFAGRVAALVGSAKAAVAQAVGVARGLTAHASFLTAMRDEVGRLRVEWAANEQSRRDAVAAGVAGEPFDLAAERLLGHWSQMRGQVDQQTGVCRQQLAHSVSAVPVVVAVRGPDGDSAADWSSLSATQRAFYLSLAQGAPPLAGQCTAAEMKAKWEELDPMVRQAYLRSDPGLYGNMDGLPAADRDLANRLSLEDDLAAVRSELANLGDGSDFESLRDNGYLGNVFTGAGYSAARVSEINGMLAVRSELDRAGRLVDPAVPVQLLVYSPEAFNGQGRAAIAVGDTANADNVVYTVPGMTADVPGYLDNQMANALNLHAAAGVDWQGRTTAVVASVGYDAPAMDLTVSTMDLAERGAGYVVGDLAGLAAMRTVVARPAHVTVIGHSYGSTTVGQAFTRFRAVADDVILIGSPGVGPGARASGFSPGSEHVWVGAASSDPVTTVFQNLQAADSTVELGFNAGFSAGRQVDTRWAVLGGVAGFGGVLVGGPVLGRAMGPAVRADLGQDPASLAFGGQRFHAETASDNQLAFGNHSEYFAPGSESLRNISAVVTGNYEAVELAEQREQDGEHYLWSDPETDHVPR